MTATVDPQLDDDGPDEMLVESVYWRPRSHRTMPHRDVLHVVQALTERGETVDLIAHRLQCSARLVKRFRVEIWGPGGADDDQLGQWRQQHAAR